MRSTSITRTPARPDTHDRVSLRVGMRIESLAASPRSAPMAECIEIGMSGLRAQAAKGFAPGTPVQASLRLPSGIQLTIQGQIVGCCTTLHLAAFGPTAHRDDDAMIEITFDKHDPDVLWPIANLISERRRPVNRRPAPTRARRLVPSSPRPA